MDRLVADPDGLPLRAFQLSLPWISVCSGRMTMRRKSSECGRRGAAERGGRVWRWVGWNNPQAAGKRTTKSEHVTTNCTRLPRYCARNFISERLDGFLGSQETSFARVHRSAQTSRGRDKAMYEEIYDGRVPGLRL